MFKVTVKIARVTVKIVVIRVLSQSDRIIKKSRKTRYAKCSICKSDSPMQEQALIIRDDIIVC